MDFLIGMGHPSWHPKRIERSLQGGDIWLYRGSFGSCIGGRHPDVIEETSRSDQYFTVNFVYHARVSPIDTVPHSLEYCPKRTVNYPCKDYANDNDTTLKGISVDKEIAQDLVETNVTVHAVKSSVIQAEEQFYRSEAMGTVANPECSKYCLKEEQDLMDLTRI